MSEISTQLGRRVKKLRLARNLTQERLAELADLNVTFIGQIERGKKSPTLDTLNKLSVAFDMSLSELFAFDIDINCNDSKTQLNNLLLEYSDKIRELFCK